MLHLRGCPAHSEFRLGKLLAQCREHVPGLTGLSADFLHIAELEAPLSVAELEQLEIEVAPRYGTFVENDRRLPILPTG